MKTLTQEVKTFYDIELDTADFANILERLHQDKENGRSITIIYPKAFDWVITSPDINEPSAIIVMKQMHGKAHGDTFKYIAETLGFDGWANAGYYNETKRVYRMTVYNRGDTLNH